MLFAPFARMQASKQIPNDRAKLKEMLARSAPASAPTTPSSEPTASASGPTTPPGGPADPSADPSRR
jgi:hypothetical protein